MQTGALQKYLKLAATHWASFSKAHHRLPFMNSTWVTDGHFKKGQSIPLASTSFLNKTFARPFPLLQSLVFPELVFCCFLPHLEPWNGFQRLTLWIEYLLSSATLLPFWVNSFMSTSHTGSKKSLCGLPCRLALCYCLIYRLILMPFEKSIPFQIILENRSIWPCLLSVSWPILNESSHALSAGVLKAHWKARSCNQKAPRSQHREGVFYQHSGFLHPLAEKQPLWCACSHLTCWENKV